MRFSGPWHRWSAPRNAPRLGPLALYRWARSIYRGGHAAPVASPQRSAAVAARCSRRAARPPAVDPCKCRYGKYGSTEKHFSGSPRRWAEGSKVRKTATEGTETTENRPAARPPGFAGPAAAPSGALRRPHGRQPGAPIGRSRGVFEHQAPGSPGHGHGSERIPPQCRPGHRPERLRMSQRGSLPVWVGLNHPRPGGCGRTRGGSVRSWSGRPRRDRTARRIARRAPTRGRRQSSSASVRIEGLMR
jgi:hypothetical protein